MRRAAVAVAALITAVLAPHSSAAPSPGAKAPVVTVIDTGVRATHRAFDYRGRTSTSDQFVGWWDFSSERKGRTVLPGPGQTWDTQVRDPYDTAGHGTLTAGMAAGRSASPGTTPSANPGGRLAVAKVSGSAGNPGSETIDFTVMGAAVRWAVDTVRTDVISISIGSIVPVPARLYQETFDAIRYARQRGVLVVVSNGNGWGNLGLLPGEPGWANSSAASPYALSVGARSYDGLLNSTDPEVSAVYSITGPSSADDRSDVDSSGTSFGTPYVAGFAAAVLAASRQGGHPLGVDALEQFVKDSSSDTSFPPQTEGYGELTQAQLPAALANARAGRLPSRPSPDTSALYVDGVVGTLRLAWTTAT